METMAKAKRALNDPYMELTSNQLLITNLPTARSDLLRHEQSVRDFLI